jgi:hypothetical protein
MAIQRRNRDDPFGASLCAATNLDTNCQRLLPGYPHQYRDRRDVPDRRKVTRNGRRASDPRPECLSGLIPGRRHTLPAEHAAGQPVGSSD